MTFKKHLSFLLVIFLLSGCSNNDDSFNFEGDWYIVYDHSVGHTHWKISDKNHVQANHHDSYLTGQYQIVKVDDDHFILESEDFYHSPEIGKIINWESDSIEFSSGLKMIRLTGETESPFSITEFNEVLNNSIWRYELYGIKTTLYLSDSLNFHGYRLADVIKTGDWNYSDRSLSWSLESFNDNYVFSHLIDVSEIATILIDKADEHEFSGRLYYYGEEIPVTVHRVSPTSKNQIELITSVLTASEWKAENFKNMKVSEAENFYLQWYGAIKFKSFETDDLSKVDFSFYFNTDQTVQLFLDGKLLEEYFWKISKDGKYLFVFTHRYGQFFFAKLDNLYDTPPMISLELDYHLSNEDYILPDDYLIFELIAH